MGNSSSTHEPLGKGRFERGTFGDTKPASSIRSSKKSKGMDRIRKSFRESFRRRKERVPESAKPHQWQSDEQAVRSATCSFPVKYLGCVEVFESRGMQVCEEALKVLRNSRRRAVRGLLQVSGDGLRVADEETKGLIVDQTIEKVSFCAPDRNHERGFSYICRDGTTRRWMCHGFLASKDSGERLSHAVGCAFAVCLERKQRRDKECGVTMTFDMKNSTFTRTGSFRAQSITDRLVNERSVDGAPSAVVTPQPVPFNPFAIDRPHATPLMLERQGSFRGFEQLGSNSPFKRQMSLRINDLPSNAERQRLFLEPITPNHRSVSPIPEVSPGQPDSVSQLCQELSQGLSLLSKNDDDLNFNNQSSVNQNTAAALLNSPVSSPTQAITQTSLSSVFQKNMSPPQNTTITEMSVISSTTTTTVSGVSGFSISNNIATVAPYTSSNPIAQVSPQRREIIQPPISRELSSPQKIIPLGGCSGSNTIVGDTTTTLPNADQWLGQVVKQTSPSPRRPPGLSGLRTKSLNNDPFDAEWASNAVQAETRSTNPFISPPKPPAKSFQVQL